jgi:hypothetical protein
MKLDLLTAAFRDLLLAELAEWAVAAASRGSRSRVGRRAAVNAGAIPA